MDHTRNCRDLLAAAPHGPGTPDAHGGEGRNQFQKKRENQANAFVSALAAREASNDKESQENDAGGKEDDVAHEQERAVC